MFYIYVVCKSDCAYNQSSTTALKNWWGWPAVGSPLPQRSKWRPMYCCWLSSRTVKKPRDGVRGCFCRCCCCHYHLCLQQQLQQSPLPPFQTIMQVFICSEFFPLVHHHSYSFNSSLRDKEKNATELIAIVLW